MGKISSFITYISASYFANVFFNFKKKIKSVLAVKYVYFHSIDRKTIFNSLMMSTVYFVHTQGQSLQSMKGSVLIDTPAIKSLGASYHIVFPGSSQDDSLFFSPGEEY